MLANPVRTLLVIITQHTNLKTTFTAGKGKQKIRVVV